MYSDTKRERHILMFMAYQGSFLLQSSLSLLTFVGVLNVHCFVHCIVYIKCTLIQIGASAF